jgi:hypothetical protein
MVIGEVAAGRRDAGAAIGWIGGGAPAGCSVNSTFSAENGLCFDRR